MDGFEKAQKRLEVILKVQGGHLTATAGAEALGVSRNTYYEWEHRALEGMMTALTDREVGRPAKPHDPEKEALLAEREDLKNRLYMAEKAKILQKILDDYELRQNSPLPASVDTVKKKKSRKKK
ncbi:MAG: hypothetical protein WCK00_13560 [Deltaproteobacteria bacterium]